MANILLKKAGIMTSLQDDGRTGFAALGVPQSGPMDSDSFYLANHLIRRAGDSACLEIYMGGIEMVFNADCQVVFTGAVGEIICQEKAISGNQIISIPKGAKVTMKPPARGQWAYMAINGQFATEKILHSQSFYPGITEKGKFSNNEKIEFHPGKETIPRNKAKIKTPVFPEIQSIEAYRGTSFALLQKNQQQSLSQDTFTISQTQNRMGIQLEERMNNDFNELISCPVYPGTVQLTPSGKLLVLMKDAQVTGGYHRILQIKKSSLSKLAQVRPSGKIRFKLISD
ncbi:MAG: biotin-dependent carboxyltransferase family protein [Cyclobacterium sp.]|uniref:5-oxoprolinase subunit C family protein n=1 Tax=unclassified Cyclobacterium TaxID=2615055 RepID=UPI0013D3D013|nr:biotin-dependent carboxyltransferase family protein [Cyclobacterium sp. SYSU L10401]